MKQLLSELDRDALVPVWRQIYNRLLMEIRSGTLGPEGKLPSANALAARFAVNRHTIRQALKALEDDGVAESRQGSGTFLVRRVVDYPISNKTRFSDIVLAQGMAPSGHILQARKRAASKEVADALVLGKRAQIILVERTVAADGVVVGIGRHFYPSAGMSGLEKTVFESRNLTEALARHGIETYFRKSTTVSARLPSSREARLLNQSVNEPLLVSKALNVDQYGKPIEFGIALFLANRVRLQFDSDPDNDRIGT